MERRLDQLEVKVAYLEQANTELGDELFRQRQQIETLREQISMLTGRIESAQSQPAVYAAEEEKPPHY